MPAYLPASWEEAVGADDLLDLELVAQAHFPVVGVVGGGDFDGAGAEFGVDVVVGDDFELNRPLRIRPRWFDRRTGRSARLWG
jgi:hypothetical protein